MRLSIRLILSLAIGVTLVSFLFALYQVRAEKSGRRNDLERRAEVLAESLQETVEPLLEKNSRKDLRRIVDRFGNRERLAGVAIYDPQGNTILKTSNLAAQLSSRVSAVDRAASENKGVGEFFKLDLAWMHVYALPLHRGDQVAGVVAVFHDATYIEAQTERIWRDTFMRILVQMVLLTAITLLIVRWSTAGAIARMVQWMRDLRAGRTLSHPHLPEEDIFKPLTQEVTHLAKTLRAAQASAEEEARLREAAESLWTSERLRVHVQASLQDSRLFVVANREPYEHVYRGGAVETVIPASGLVTALEPILRACDGTWIAHGAGDADREAVDAYDHLRVPPEDPQYTLRRVWLTREEEQGYYFGFANEGLWPLCHIAHARPIFRGDDWGHYRAVNRKFAEAVLQEVTHEDQPAILVQDYHFALLPQLIKDRRPDARVAIFWHIPWPNPEAFGICPWQRELLEGLLGADLIGFHIQSHCNNFLETVDRTLESRIEWERFAVNRGGHLALVRSFPISVHLGEGPPERGLHSLSSLERTALCKQLGLKAELLGVGADRVDYTKGIPERFRGIELFLEKYPAYRERFTFVQIAAPSRTHIKRYQDLLAEVEAEAERINWRFQAKNWKPIVLRKRHHSHQEIEQYYRVADLCLVTSLHDGMNLVAKEFVAARDDEDGVLILSRFTGAARELRDALIVNPYDTEQLAEATKFALEMDPEDRKTRMRRMRRIVREHNIYRWAANLIGELSEIRLEEIPEGARSPAGETESLLS